MEVPAREKERIRGIGRCRYLALLLFVAGLVFGLLGLPAGASAGVGIGSAASVDGAGQGADFHAPVTRLDTSSSVSLRALAKNGLAAKVWSDEPASGALTVMLPDAVSISSGGTKVQPLATSSFELQGSRNYLVRVRLSARGLRVLRTARVDKLTVTFAASDPGGNRAAPLTKYVTVR